MRLTDSIFPRYCVRCGEEGQLLCDKCNVNWHPGRIPAKCVVCGKESIFGETCARCTEDNTPDGHLTTFAYADPVARALIGNWKYHYDETAWNLLRTRIGVELNQVRQCLDTFGIQSVLAIPLHRRRVCERGFDQSKLCAEFIATTLGKEKADILERVRGTGKQAHRSDKEREEEMKDSPFQILSGMYVPKKILLVDDVWTTGSTARAAIRTLRCAGAEVIWVYTIARG
ncbi:MAG: double zinc ribbon domain-containing protein [Patescibacteria group bacterium]|nr:hypothetical protein [Patescibacteria group bacterium]